MIRTALIVCALCVLVCGCSGPQTVAGACNGPADCASRCDNGAATACTRLGLILSDGEGVPRNRQSAIARFVSACEAGQPAGCYHLAHATQTEAPEAAFGVLGKACRLGSAHACRDLEFAGLAWLDDAPVSKPRDMSRVLDLAQAGCDRGEPDDCDLLSELEGTPSQSSAQLRRVLCAQGSLRACRMLALANVPESPAVDDVCAWGDGLSCALLAAGPDVADPNGLHAQVACEAGFGDACLDWAEHQVDRAPEDALATVVTACSSEGVASASACACLASAPDGEFAVEYGCRWLDRLCSPSGCSQSVFESLDSLDPVALDARACSLGAFERCADGNRALRDATVRCDYLQDLDGCAAAGQLMFLGSLAKDGAPTLDGLVRLMETCAQGVGCARLVSVVDEVQSDDAATLGVWATKVGEICAQQPAAWCGAAGERLLSNVALPDAHERAVQLFDHACDAEDAAGCLQLYNAWRYGLYGLSASAELAQTYRQRLCEVTGHPDFCY